MKLKPRKRYTAEFKAQAVELLDTGKPVTQLAEDLCISSNLHHLQHLNPPPPTPPSSAPAATAGCASPQPSARNSWTAETGRKA
jgi:transposase-like protein